MNDRNYYLDSRVLEQQKTKYWFIESGLFRLTEEAVEWLVECGEEENTNGELTTHGLTADNLAELRLACKFDMSTCDMCHGKGTVVNPSIDAGGLTAEDFYDDPDFAEDYMNGRFDQGCPRCGGCGTEVGDITLLDESFKWILDSIESMERMDAEFARESAYERAMGC